MHRHPLALLSSLYAAQGLPFGFFTLALPVLMREAGWSLTAIGLLQLLGPADTQPGDALAAGKPTRYADLMTPEGLQDIAGYADIIGPWTRQLIPVTEDGALGTPTPLMADVRRAGLQVWPYTFRPENHFLPPALWRGGDPRTVNPDGSIAEIRAYLVAGIDGFFSFDSVADTFTHCFAAPVKDPQGVAICTLCIVAPRADAKNNYNDYRRVLIESANSLARRINE